MSSAPKRASSVGEARHGAFSRFVPYAGVATVSGIALVAGLVRDRYLAAVLGASDTLDAFVLGTSVLLYLANIVATPLGTVFVPSLVRADRAHDAASVSSLRRQLSTWALWPGLAFAALLAASAYSLGPVLAGESRALGPATSAVLWSAALVVPLTALARAQVAVANARQLFVGPQFGSVIRIAGFLACVAVVPRLEPHWLGLALVFGAAVELTFAVTLVRRRIGSKVFPVAESRKSVADKRSPAADLGSLALGVALVGSALLVDNLFAARLGEGAVTIINFGSKLVSAGTSVVGGAMGTVLLPRIAARIAAEGRALRPSSLVQLASGPLLVGCGMMAALLVFGPFALELIFSSGFGASEMSQITQVHVVYALQCPAYLANVALTRALAAAGRPGWLTPLSMISMSANIGLNAWWAPQWGVVGIAWATVVAMTLAPIVCFVLLLVARRRGG